MAAVNEWVYIHEGVVTSRHRTVHVQRMNLYADSSFQVTEDVRNQAAYDDVTHGLGLGSCGGYRQLTRKRQRRL